MLLWTALFVGTIANIHLAEKNEALLIDLLKVKNTQKRSYSLNNHNYKPLLNISRGKLSMNLAPYRYPLKRIAKRWRSKNIIASVGLGFTIFCKFLQIIFCCHIHLFIFSADYWFLLLTVDFFCILFKKEKKKQIRKKEMKYSEKEEFVKER